MLLLGVSCGLIVANLYYAQPVADLIAASLGTPSPTSSRKRGPLIRINIGGAPGVRPRA